MARTEIKISTLKSLPKPVEMTDLLAIVSDNKTYNIKVGKFLEDIYSLLDGKEDYLGLPPKDGYILSSDIQGNRSWVAGGSGGGVPSGGVKDDILVKQSDVDGDVAWEDRIIYKGVEIPDDSLGREGDMYLRYGITGYGIIDGNTAGPDSDPQNTSGQFYNGNVNLWDGNGYDPDPIEIYLKANGQWILQKFVPKGGTAGQVLSKISATNGDITWTDMPEQIVWKGEGAPAPDLGQIGDKYMEILRIETLPAITETATFKFDVYQNSRVFSPIFSSLDPKRGGIIGKTPINFIRFEEGMVSGSLTIVFDGAKENYKMDGAIINYSSKYGSGSVIIPQDAEMYNEEYGLYYMIDYTDGDYQDFADAVSKATANFEIVDISVTYHQHTRPTDYQEYTKTNEGWKKVLTPVVFKGKGNPDNNLGKNGDKYMQESEYIPVDFDVFLEIPFRYVEDTKGFPYLCYSKFGENTIPVIEDYDSGAINIRNGNVDLVYFGIQNIDGVDTLAFQLKNGEQLEYDGKIYLESNSVIYTLPAPKEAFVYSINDGGVKIPINAYLMTVNDTFLTQEEKDTITAIIQSQTLNPQYRIFENKNEISGLGSLSDYIEFTKAENEWVQLPVVGLEVVRNRENDIGYRVTRTDSRNFADIGSGAIDFSHQTSGNGGGAVASYSIASGVDTIASGDYSVAMGYKTTSNNYTSVTMGKYNIGTATDTVFEFGIGVSDTDRKNAFEIYTDGRIKAPELSISLINDPKSLVTKEYVLSNGNTASRPSAPSIGQFYFDTDLSKPIWYSGSNWVDATGTAV